MDKIYKVQEVSPIGSCIHTETLTREEAFDKARALLAEWPELIAVRVLGATCNLREVARVVRH